MPYAYEVHPEHGLAVLTLSGDVTKKDLLGALTDLANDPRYSRDMNRLWDLRDVISLNLSLDKMEDVRTGVESISTNGRTAIVAHRKIDELAAHYFRVYIRKREIHVFESMKKARAWLAAS
jgi:hypothetical protein